MSNLDVKSKPPSLVIPLTWQSTTAPEPPVRLPIDVKMTITEDAIHIHAERTGTLGGDEEADPQFEKGDIVDVEVILMPPIPEDTNMAFVRDDAFSRAIIRVRDPFEVEPFFENTFASDKAYWLKAVAKSVREKLGVKLTIKETKKAASV
jgi:hypothetical protein